MSKRKASTKSPWDENMKDKNHISYFDDDDGMNLTSSICEKVRSRRPFSNNQWNNHAQTKGQLSNIAILVFQKTITNMFRLTSS